MQRIGKKRNITGEGCCSKIKDIVKKQELLQLKKSKDSKDYGFTNNFV